MLTKDFNYNLPKELIAKEPVFPRDTSRLMVLKKVTHEIKHHIFNELPDLLSDEYVLVLNKTRVFPAKLEVNVDGKVGELLLIKEIDGLWQCMVKPGKKIIPGKTMVVCGKKENIKAEVKGILEDGTRTVKFDVNEFNKWIEKNGYAPLPPYIKGSKAGMNEYQTVYAQQTGSIAAPTAGFHFTEDVFAKLAEKGIERHFVTLHVGRGTFLPVKTDNIEDHKMHSEWYEMSAETAASLNKARAAGKKIIAVGTTSIRVLESNFDNGFHAETGNTNIFIYPGYEFKAVDGMITNFHLPESTLIMLISAFAGKEFVFKAYEEAIHEKYRFYSFGDAMLIV
jgi:S-adenosylmethionine:tRNA ribosyltransferase-isomerase